MADPAGPEPTSDPTTAVPKRLVAYLLDVLPFAVWAWVLGAIARPASNAPVPEWHHDGVRVWIATLVTMSLPTWLYFALCDSSAAGATVGKRLLGLRVETSDGARVSRGRAFVRTAVKLLPWEIAHASMFLPTPIADAGEAGFARPGFMLSVLLTGSWLVTVLLTKDHAAVHDLFARTRVVPAPRGSSSG